MIFFLAIMLLMFGFIFAAIPVFLPAEIAAALPTAFSFIFIFIGLTIALIGQLMLFGRAKSTTAIHLLDKPKRNHHLWLYAHRDGSLMFTPGIRNVESQLYSPELDAQIQEFKSYRMFDHSIRIVPEGVGHAVDLGMVLYAQLMKNKYGFENIQEARDAATFLEKLNPIKGQYDKLPASEHFLTQKNIQRAINLRRGEIDG